jgi:hypothetical protein
MGDSYEEPEPLHLPYLETAPADGLGSQPAPPGLGAADDMDGEAAQPDSLHLTGAGGPSQWWVSQPAAGEDEDDDEDVPGAAAAAPDTTCDAVHGEAADRSAGAAHVIGDQQRAGEAVDGDAEQGKGAGETFPPRKRFALVCPVCSGDSASHGFDRR